MNNHSHHFTNDAQELMTRLFPGLTPGPIKCDAKWKINRREENIFYNFIIALRQNNETMNHRIRKTVKPEVIHKSYDMAGQ